MYEVFDGMSSQGIANLTRLSMKRLQHPRQDIVIVCPRVSLQKALVATFIEFVRRRWRGNRCATSALFMAAHFHSLTVAV